MTHEIKIGDIVTWESQSGGGKTSKTGKVLAVVTVGVSPRAYAIRHFPEHTLMFDGHTVPRGNSIAYLIEVRETSKQKPKLYMPRPQWLKVVEEMNHETL